MKIMIELKYVQTLEWTPEQGERLRILRKQSKQKKLSNHPSLPSRMTLLNYEKGINKSIPYATLQTFCDVFQCGVDYFYPIYKLQTPPNT